MQKSTEKKKKRRDLAYSEAIVRDAFLKLLRDNKGRMPSARELSKKTGYSPRTIEKRIKEMKFEPEKSLARVLTKDVVLAIYRTAMKGNHNAQKLWMQIQEQWSDRLDVTSNGESIRPLNITVNDKKTAKLLDGAIKTIGGKG